MWYVIFVDGKGKEERKGNDTECEDIRDWQGQEWMHLHF